MVRTQIQLTEEQISLLKKKASNQHISVAELIRRAIDMLINSGGVIDTEERQRRAISVAGSFHSGVSDLSTKHDRYLAEEFGK